MRLTKKQRERQSLDAVLRHLSALPSSIEETEEPDFLFNLGLTTIGAEVTELYLPSPPNTTLPEQAKENEERHMVDLARQQAIQMEVPPQQLQLRISSHFLTKQKRQSCASEIANFVAANFAQPGEVKSFQCHELPPCIVHMTLYGLRRTPHIWNSSCSGWVDSNFAPGFQAAIDKKEALRQKYLMRCVEIWLITVATHSGGSSFIEWSPDLAAHQFLANFDRIFFVEGHPQKVSELQIEARII